MRRAVVAGGSIAGLTAAARLVDGGYPGRVTVLEAGHEHPVDRTTLSKGFLTGDLDLREIALQVHDGIDLRLGTTAVALDPQSRTLATTTGTLRYDDLVIATGGAAVMQPSWEGLAGVNPVRTLAQATTVGTELARARQVAVIGAGVLGLELATAAASLGLDVTVIENESRPLPRILPAPLGDRILDLASELGIDVRCGARVDQLLGPTRVTGVRLEGGTIVPADCVLVAIGSRPTTEWLAPSGLNLDGGVVCDDHLRTGVPHVYAAGDVARFSFHGRSPIRCEHWTRAGLQGEYVGRLILDPTIGPFEDDGYVWSDTLGTRLQSVGRTTEHADAIIDGRDGVRMASLHRDGDRIVGASAVGWQRLLISMRALLAAPDGWQRALAAVPGDGQVVAEPPSRPSQ